MQAINTLLQTNLPKLQQPVPQHVVTAKPNFKSSGKCTEYVNKVFLKFSIFYGHIWRSQFKNDYFFDLARSEWKQAINDFDESEIDAALEECLKQRDMPPTLAQFIDSCKKHQNKGVVFYRPMVVEKASPSVAAQNLRKMKMILNMRIT